MDYPYKPLAPNSPEIRLLVLSPGIREAPIECTLHHASLDSSPHYEALSYTWGDARDRRPITLNNRPWHVTANLEVALRHLRSETEARTLWIDALCINQDDLQERAEQVQRMRRIYLSAATVLAWLGEASGDSDAAMEQVLEIGLAVERVEYDLPDDESVGGGVGESRGSVLTPQLLLRVGIDTEAINWAALWALWNRPYWSRIWVVQELASCGVMADEGEDRCLVGCGSKWLPKRMLDAALTVLVSVVQAPFLWTVDSFRFLEPLRTLLTRGNPQAMHMFSALKFLSNHVESYTRSMTWLLYTTREFKATDDRDKLYALLGLVRKSDALFLPVPDYTKPKERVFMELIKATIEAHCDLDCLGGNRTMTNHSGPSWIPELQATATSGPSWISGQGHFRASAHSEICVSVDEHAGLLTARGIDVGVVEEVVGPFIPASETPEEELTDMQSLLDRQGFDAYWQRIKAIHGSLPPSQHEHFWRAFVMTKI